jgi:predicted RNase H-like nuclease (RuvC/YqgF family)
MKKTVQELKAEIEAIKKTQTEVILEMENLGKRTGTTDTNITKRIQEMEERISGVKNTIEEIDTSVKENEKKIWC